MVDQMRNPWEPGDICVPTWARSLGESHSIQIIIAIGLHQLQVVNRHAVVPSWTQSLNPASFFGGVDMNVRPGDLATLERRSWNPFSKVLKKVKIPRRPLVYVTLAAVGEQGCLLSVLGVTNDRRPKKDRSGDYVVRL